MLLKAETIIYNARLKDSDQSHMLIINEGEFTAIESQRELHLSVKTLPYEAHHYLDANGQLVLPGLVETHIHLDKACISSRCSLHKGTLEEAIQETTRAKQSFDYQDVYNRGKQVIEKAILQGTSYMRTHVEIDPNIGLIGFEAIKQLKQDFNWAMDIELCVFPQEGLHNNPGTLELLEEALKSGADLLGGCPYTDSHPRQQIETLFQLASKYDVDLDFHLDFDLDPSVMSLPDIVTMTQQFHYQHRVTVGHVTKLSALPKDRLQQIAEDMANAGVQLTSLPSTDLFLNGRESEYNIPRGVAPLHKISQFGVVCSISSNNIENPFTPYGDASQVRQANLFANITQLGTPEDLSQCMAWVSDEAAKIMKLSKYGIKLGGAADINLYPAKSVIEVIATIVPPSMGMKRGKITFNRASPQLMTP
jgi:cytosine deaminase